MLCFYFRYLIHRKSDRLEKINRPMLSRHLYRCAACRDYDNRMVRFGAQMKESACGQLSETGVKQIETSVLKALEAFDAVKLSTRSQRHLRTKIGIPCAVAAGFMVIAGLIGWVYWTNQRHIDGNIAAHEAMASLRGAAAFGDNISLLNLLTEQPVRQEMTKLANDAHQAVALITNCIPQGSLGLAERAIPGETPEIPGH